MKKQSFLLWTLACSTMAAAQSADRQVIGSSGGSYSSPIADIDYTVGETITASGSSGTFSINQGFQQPAENSSAIAEQKILVDFSLFPNPAQNLISLQLNSTKALELNISMTNAMGQKLLTNETVAKINNYYRHDFPIQTLASGIYFINLIDTKNQLVQSIRFIKQ